MQRIYRIKMKSFARYAFPVLLLICVSMPTANAASLIRLGAMYGVSYNAINNIGVVGGLGYDASNNIILRTWANNTITDIPNIFGSPPSTGISFYGISDLGQLVGSSTTLAGGTLTIKPFIAQGTTMSPLWANGEAYAISNDGSYVAGVGYITRNGAPGTAAFLWKNGNTTQLPDLNYPNGNSATAVNNSGVAVGLIPPALGGDPKIVKWSNGVMTDLGFPAVKASTTLRINNNNLIAAGIATSVNQNAVYVWQSGSASVITPYTPYQAPYVGGVSNLGQVAGGYWATYQTNFPVAFVWQNGKTINLNRLPNINYPDPSFRYAYSINDAGQVLVTTYGLGELYLLTLPANLFSKSDDTTASDTTLSGADSSPSDPTKAKCLGMCGYDAHTSKISLNLNDTPVGYTSSVGPSVFVRLTYSHKTNSQPASPNFFNVGPNWTLNVLSYVQDDPNFAGQSVGRYVAGGGYIDYPSELGAYNGTTGFFPNEAKTQAKLVRIPSNGTLSYYELRFPDGSIHKYSLMDGANTYPRRVFLTEIKDPQGNKLTLNYDGQLRLTNIADAAGRLTTFSYGNTNPKLVTQITDPFGRSAALGYTSGKLTSITDVIGITSSFTYNSTGDTTFIKTLETPYGLSNFTYTEDSATNSKWLEMADALGKIERLESRPNAPNVQATETAVPTGIRFVNGQYNERNTFYWDRYALTKARQNVGDTPDYTMAYATHWLMNGFGEQSGIVESVKAPIDNRDYLFYPNNDYPSYATSTNKPSMVAKVLDDGTTQTSQALTVNAWGQPTDFYDPLNRRTNYSYDNATNIDLTAVWHRTANGLEQVASYTYYTGPGGAPHRPSGYGDAAGRPWSYGYNAAGQLTSVQNPQFKTTQYTYDTYGRLTAVYNTNNVKVKEYNYPCNTSTTGTVNCNLPNWVKDYDGVDPAGYQRSYLYDKLDRITQVTYPDGTTETFNYNFPSGWTTNGHNYTNTTSLHVWQYKDRMGRYTNYAYDRVGRLLSKSETVSIANVDTVRTTSYAYYENGTLKELTDGNGNVTHWDIDLQSRPTKKTYAYGSTTTTPRTEEYTYDSIGRLKTVKDADGRIKTITYNVDNTIAALNYTKPQGSTLPDTPNVTYKYDSYWPRMTEMEDGSGHNGARAKTLFEYTPLGVDGALQLQSETNDQWYNQHMGYFYDAFGRLSQRWSAESPETFTYDTLGRIATYEGDNGKSTFAYLGQTGLVSNRTQTYTNASNVVITLPTAYSYDTTTNDRRLLAINHPSIARSYSYAYGYTDAGVAKTDVYNIRTQTETAPVGHPWPSQTWTYSYDKGDRLLSASGNTAGTYNWQYDKADNITQAQNPSYTDSPTYNANNQLTKFAWWQNVFHDASGDTVDDGNRTYKWDFEGRLVEIDFPNNPGYVMTYGYDGLGRRIVNTVNDHGNITQLTLVWCGERPCQLRNNTLSLRRYLLNGEYDNVSGDRYLYLTDHLGSVRDMASVATGARVGSLDYTAYGQQRITPVGIQPHFQYAGLMWDGQAGVYLSATRPYEAGLSRWLTRDPIREAGGINLYGYAGANPIMHTDPNGKIIPLILACSVNPVCVEGAAVIVLGVASLFSPAAAEMLDSMPPTGIVVAEKSAIYTGSRLARALAEAGRPVIKGLEEAHHIVPRKALVCEAARDKLRDFGIGIDDAVNGISLPYDFHRRMHTGQYYTMISDVASGWTSADQAIADLERIAENIRMQAGK